MFVVIVYEIKAARFQMRAVFLFAARMFLAGDAMLCFYLLSTDVDESNDPDFSSLVRPLSFHHHHHQGPIYVMSSTISTAPTRRRMRPESFG